MTIKSLWKGSARNVAGTSKADQVITLYTVPTGKTAFVKEILGVYVWTTSMAMTLYVLKSGGTDITPADNNANNQTWGGKKTTDTLQIAATEGAASNFITLARNLVLNAGDAIKIHISDVVAAGTAWTAGTAGFDGIISGDET